MECFSFCVTGVICGHFFTQNVIVTLYKTPEAERLSEFYKQAVTTCGK